MNRFLQIHTLVSYPSALLNRDDVGFAKRIPFGGTVRTRISSQCLKRHWRVTDSEHALSRITLDGSAVPMSVRSRVTFEREIRDPLVAEGLAPTLVDEVVGELMAFVVGESERVKKDKTKEAKEGKGKKAATTPAAESERAAIETKQVIILGRPEIEFLRGEARTLCGRAKETGDAASAVKEHFTKERLKNLGALRLGAGLDAALFGRMVTGDVLARCDAAIHVAHAMTVHEETTESDYFSAVDDLLAAEGETGSGHINSTELTSGLFYVYVVVDVPLLVSNLEGCDAKDWVRADRSLAADVIARLVHLVATVSPGAKRGSTAPYSYAHLVAVEAGNAQPRTLVNAFLQGVRGQDDLLGVTYGALSAHWGELDGMYDRTTQRRLAGLGPSGKLGESVGAGVPVSLADLATWAASQIRGA